MTRSEVRYAIYFAPDPTSPLWRFGSGMIGYDAAAGADLPLQAPSGTTLDEWRRLTAEPRRYGFHATLKAPFHLDAGVSEAHLIATFDAFGARTPAARLLGLDVAVVSRFIALTPGGPNHALHRLADATVLAFEPCRAPLTGADHARRLASQLTPRQIGYLDRYGYPYVLDEFRFHMTLAGPVAAADRQRLVDELRRAYRERVPSGATSINALCLLRQDDREQRFRIIRRTRLADGQPTSTEPG